MVEPQPQQREAGRTPARRAELAARITVRGVALATRQVGEGVPFLWGHGLLVDMAQEDAAGWFDFSAVAEHVRWVRYDARGHGASEATWDPADYRFAALAQDMLGLGDALGAGRVLLGGLSLGCATALHAAVAAPQRVAGLVLVAPPTAWETRPRQALFYRGSATLVDWLGLGPLRWLAALPGLASASPVVATLQRGFVEHLAGADPRAVAAALRGAAASDLPDPEALRALRMPALILAWRDDPVHPVSTARRLAELLPQAELRLAPGLDEIRSWPERVAGFVACAARRA